MNLFLRWSKRIVSTPNCISLYARRAYILGIETSCDDTGAAIVSSQGEIVAEAIHNQTRISTLLGGVLPLVAAQLHTDHIHSIVNQCFQQANLQWKDLDAIAVTTMPGMAHSLEVGLSFAKTHALQYNLPIIPIHHMEAHALTCRLEHKVPFPFLVLLVSGGHALLALVRNATEFYLLGQNTEMSPGDCMDKIARRLKVRNLGPPFHQLSGGQCIELLAQKGNPRAFTINTSRDPTGSCDFAFSGVQTSVYNWISSLEAENHCHANQMLPNIPDICASFQYALFQLICAPVQRAMRYIDYRGLFPTSPVQQYEQFAWCHLGEVPHLLKPLKEDSFPVDFRPTLVVSGGVASNAFLRKCLQKLCDHFGYAFVCPSVRLCTDNGVMIAWNAYEKFYASSSQNARQACCVIGADNIQSLRYEPRAPFSESLENDIIACGIKLERIKYLDT